MTVRTVVEIRSAGRNQDRAQCFRSSGLVVLALADGAGGFGDGAKAAERVLAEAQAFSVGVHKSPAASLASADVALAGEGLSTGIIIEVRRNLISGASVGDSIAWLVAEGLAQELTSAQRRKPLLGDGASPMSFCAELRGRLLLASDGLVNYASRSAIIAAASGADLQTSAKLLAELPRLPNGEFPDDVSVLLAEPEV